MNLPPISYQLFFGCMLSIPFHVHSFLLNNLLENLTCPKYQYKKNIEVIGKQDVKSHSGSQIKYEFRFTNKIKYDHLNRPIR